MKCNWMKVKKKAICWATEVYIEKFCDILMHLFLVNNRTDFMQLL
jgi:hypothetical protein